MLLNIFYNGTNSNYTSDFGPNSTYPYGEIVSRFGKYASEAPNANVLRINGVGSGKVTTQNPIIKKILTARALPSTLTGWGMRDDVESILNFVLAGNKYLEQNGGSTLSVVLMGWSRGGIGCIYAAHMLSQLWSRFNISTPLEIKVIAYDPVSGIGTNVRALDMSWTETFVHSLGLLLGDSLTQTISLTQVLNQLTNWWELPLHVKQYHGFYAHDERSIGFAATMPEMTDNLMGRIYNLYEVPGTHSSLVGNYSLGTADAQILYTGLSIYRSVVLKSAQLMTNFGVQFAGGYTQWFNIINNSNTANMGDLLNFKRTAQKKYITTNFSEGGRGMYLGDNMLDRKWAPDVSLTQFLAESNAKFFLDFTNETKIQKLGANVRAYNYGTW